METVDKKGTMIQTGKATVSYIKFLKDIIKPFKEIRVGVKCSNPPFSHIYLKTYKKELIDIIRIDQMRVTFSIMFNSRVKKNTHDILYIHKLKITII